MEGLFKQNRGGLGGSVQKASLNIFKDAGTSKAKLLSHFLVLMLCRSHIHIYTLWARCFKGTKTVQIALWYIYLPNSNLLTGLKATTVIEDIFFLLHVLNVQPGVCCL